MKLQLFPSTPLTVYSDNDQRAVNPTNTFVFSTSIKQIHFDILYSLSIYLLRSLSYKLFWFQINAYGRMANIYIEPFMTLNFFYLCYIAS